MPKGIYERKKDSKIYLRKITMTPEQDQQISKLSYAGERIGDLAKMFSVSNRWIRDSLRRTNTLTIGRRDASGSRNPAWKGGRFVDKDGYVLLHRPKHPHSTSHSYIREHRLVMENLLGRYLKKTEVVHHKNNNRQDNSPENLLLFSSNGVHLGVELMGKIPKWTPEGFQKMSCKRVLSQKGKPHSAKGTGVRLLRKTLISQFLHETSQLQDIGLVAELPQLPSFRLRKKEREKV